MKLRNSSKKGLIKAANSFQPWDYSFLLELEYQSLKVMYKYYSEHNEVDIAKHIKLAINLLDIILEVESSLHFKGNKPYLDKYVNIRNWSRFFPNTEVRDTPSFKDALRVEKAWYLYHLLRFRELRHFWD